MKNNTMKIFTLLLTAAVAFLVFPVTVFDSDSNAGVPAENLVEYETNETLPLSDIVSL